MRKLILPYLPFSFFLMINIAFWTYSKNVQMVWANVPEAPSEFKATTSFLGDRQMAYRAYAYILQNMGSVDGKVLSLREYNYENLRDWFFLEHALDDKSDIAPALAAYYYGSTKDEEDLKYIIDYLKVVGQSPEGQKWRWLGHAVYLARHQVNDNDLALELAYLLADNKSPSLASWAKQMPVFVLKGRGDNALAYKIMLNILISNVDTMHPNEIFYMKDYICNTLLPTIKGEQRPPFCDDIQ
jgi:hypothetical protein